MIFKMAWKNIWRNKVRTLIILISIVLGIWAGTFILAYAFGLIEQRVNDAIGYEVSHLQIHQPDYLLDNDPQFVIKKSTDLLNTIKKDERVKAASQRTLVHAMLATASNNAGAKTMGIEPQGENTVTQIASCIVDGEYLEDSDKNKILIGKKLAEKLKLKIRSKIVLTFQDTDKNIVSAAFRVKGVFSTYNAGLEQSTIYALKKDLDRLLNLKQEAHEIAILLQGADLVTDFTQEQKSKFAALSIRTWSEIVPELALMTNSLDQYLVIFLLIILLALSFGIINVMLMAVLERVREIGMLMAIGMSKLRLFFMVVLETCLVFCLAAPLGLLLAFGVITYLQNTGLDLSSAYGESYGALGFRTIIYPQLQAVYYLRIMLMVAVTAILASIYPAYTALRLEPVEAIRKI